MVMDTSQFLVIWTNKKRDVATFSRENSTKQCEVTFLHHMSASCLRLPYDWLHMTLILLSSTRLWRQSTLPETMKTEVWRGTEKTNTNYCNQSSAVQLMWIKTSRASERLAMKMEVETGRRQLINLWSRAAEMLLQLISRSKTDDLIDKAISAAIA